MTTLCHQTERSVFLISPIPSDVAVGKVFPTDRFDMLDVDDLTQNSAINDSLDSDVVW
jgi:hypothetical protein